MELQRFFKKSIAVQATLAFFIGGLLSPTVSFAGTVDITLNFDKRPAKFGLAYIYDETAPALQGIIDQKDKKFIDGIVPASPGSTLIFKNSDSVDHNIFANEISDNLSLQFDVGLMPVNSEQQIPVDWAHGTLVRVGCKIHPKMKAYIANIKAQEMSIFEFNKKVSDYTTTLHSTKDSAEIKILLDRYAAVHVTILPGESQTIDLTKKGKKRGSVTIAHH